MSHYSKKKSDVASTTLRIQNEEEKKKISKLSSEDVVASFGMKKIIGADSMTNRQMKIFFMGDETRRIMEKQREQTQKLAQTAHILNRSYQDLIHHMPLTFDSENLEYIRELQLTKILHKEGFSIQKASWLKKSKFLGKISSSLIIWFENTDQVDNVITKCLIWKCQRKSAKIFRSRFQVMQCFNCQKYGHIALLHY